MKTDKNHEHNQEIMNVNFVGIIGPMVGISTILTIISLVLIFTKGLNYGIDFSGGAEIQTKFATVVSPEELRDFAGKNNLRGAMIQRLEVKDGSEYVIRFESKIGASEKETNDNLNEEIKKVQGAIKNQYSGAEIRRVDTVGPQVGNQLKKNGILAVFYSMLCILIYVGLRFDYKYAPGAVICLIHDTMITLGVLCILKREVNVHIMAAILTIIGYSLNDTIVVFDRIRENVKKLKDMDLSKVINISINETLNRTILTSFTVFLASLSLYLYAGGVIEEFAFAMLIGVATGTYSSVYVASPLVLLIDKLKTQKPQTKFKPASA